MARELEDVLAVVEEAAPRRAARRTRGSCSTTSSGTSSRRRTCAPRRTGTRSATSPSSSSNGWRDCSSSSASYSSARRSRSRWISSVGRSMCAPDLIAFDVADQRRVRDARIVEPAAVVVVEPVAGRHVEPRVLDLLELREPAPSGLARGQLRVDLVRRAALDERAVDAGVDRELGQPPQLRVGLEQQHVDARDHLRDVLVGDVGQVRPCRTRRTCRTRRSPAAGTRSGAATSGHRAAARGRRRRGPRRTRCCARRRRRPRPARTPVARAPAARRARGSEPPSSPATCRIARSSWRSSSPPACWKYSARSAILAGSVTGLPEM